MGEVGILDMDEKVYEFDVALSFAGEDRAHAERLANLLQHTHVRVFYDEFVKATLWGKDLYQHLETIYKDQAKYCVVFVSEAYITKNWTKHELRQAQLDLLQVTGNTYCRFGLTMPFCLAFRQRSAIWTSELRRWNK